MKALIFNSGIGRRLGDLTLNSPKSMIKLLNGESLFERQIRILQECGIKEFVITTGPFEEQLVKITKKNAYKDLIFHFIHNNRYDHTNYIYSCYLAREYLDDDFITLHGDLVFNHKVVKTILECDFQSCGFINEKIVLPKKDFKARVINNKIVEVGINIFDDGCFAFQPFYKLSRKDLKIWIDAIVDFVENRNELEVYAENAFNEVSLKMDVKAISYDGLYINEIDDIVDYEKVSKEIEEVDYKDQEIVCGFDNLKKIIMRNNIKKPLVVIESFFMNSNYKLQISKIVNAVFFNDFRTNPVYEDCVKAVKLFKDSECDSLISLGGGSAIDTAKAIKLFLPMDEKNNYLQQKHIYINLKHIAIPTTAGTGSESTKFSVIYYEGKKQSLTNDMLIPNVAILEPDFLKTLPIEQKKATIFDALCHGIESMWSINSNNQSVEYAQKSISLILKNIDWFLDGKFGDFKKIYEAANLAGKAINISQTTAAHALSYKVSSLYGIPHGKAVALLLTNVWKKIINNKNKIIDERGVERIDFVLGKLNKCFGVRSTQKAVSIYSNLIKKYFGIEQLLIDNDSLQLLISSVNMIRLKNFPIELTVNDIKDIYCGI